ncbi:MAG: sulfite exporter TauE/SafE family protein [Pseudomonadota bacterium]|nr:sulfite exporter TauE/SafE family protein [Pseudomonadota bacterium]
MDGTVFDLIIFLSATFAAAIVAGLAGFAFGLVAAAVWLHILTPLQTAALIIAFGLIVQGYSVWQLRTALDWRKLWPFLLGGALGVPLGVAILGWTNPAYVRAGTGGLLILYSLYALARPNLKPLARGGIAADAGVGFLNGILGGITGLAGILVTIWCGLRGWPKDQQRAVFQPAAVAIFAMSALWLGATHAVTVDILNLFMLGLPALFAGTWLGLKLYGRLDEAAFRKVVLVLLLISGAALVLAR